MTDGRYVYMRVPVTEMNTPLFNFNLMPTHMRSRFSVEELRGMELHPSFNFHEGCPDAESPMVLASIIEPTRSEPCCSICSRTLSNSIHEGGPYHAKGVLPYYVKIWNKRAAPMPDPN